MTRAWTWTGETLTAPTRRATSVSSRAQSTSGTGAACRTCSDVSPSLSTVYDIAHAGPRNRFTIRTNSGHLIVHNCGYQGWLGAARAFEMPGTDDDIKADILAWRAASPAIVWLWGGQTLGTASSIRGDGFADRWDRTPHYFGVEGMAISAILDPGTEYAVKRLDGTDSGIAFLMRGKTLYCRLPSGRWLTYHDARVDQSERGLSISYWGNNTNPKNGPIGWIEIRTWGGRLAENINQATCRDILRFACINLEQRGYPVVLHVYDEIVCEIPEGFGSLEEFEAIVTVPPFWARDWPIRAPGGWRAKRYRKG